MRILSRALRFSTLAVASEPLGTEMSPRSKVRMRVERRPMSSTVPMVSTHAAEIADAHHAVGEDADSAEEILDGLLRGQSDGDAADAESGECRRKIEARKIQDAEQRRGGDDDLHHAMQQQGERERAAIFGGGDAAAHAARPHGYEIPQQPRHGDQQRGALHLQ